MVNVPIKYKIPFNKNTLLSINQTKKQDSVSRQSLLDLNHITATTDSEMVITTHTTSVQNTPITNNHFQNQTFPELINPLQKGQKITLDTIHNTSKIKACLGWNIKDSRCDVDVSAFLLNATSKVLGDEWFVFYGQTNSPDHSVSFHMDGKIDREFITIDFSKLNTNVSKIVFVLTINDALLNHLNFSMISDAYLRIIDLSTNHEIAAYQMTDYYSNVTSMMIGEIYLHKGNWKFTAIGNGVERDLAGLCELYGVQTT